MMGMVSLGPVRSRFKALFLGGVARLDVTSPVRDVRSIISVLGSGLTTTMGGVGITLSETG
jgi:hypothetical protein